MGKSPCREKTESVKKGPWTPEEDQKMMAYIEKHGHGKWRTLSKNAGLKRCGKSCRLRWTNYLRPDIKRGMFSLEEEDIIVKLHSMMGNKWSAIAARLPGRTDNEIKNYWNTNIRKRLLKMGIDPITHTPCLDLPHLSSVLTSSFQTSSPSLNQSNFLSLNPDSMNRNLLDFASSLFSSSYPPHNSSEVFVNNPLSRSLEENGCNPFEQNTIQSYPSNQIHNPTLENQLNTPSNNLCAPFWTGKPEQGYPDFNILECLNSDMDWWGRSGEPKNLAAESLMTQPNSGFCDNFDQPFVSIPTNQTSMSNGNVHSQHSSSSTVLSVPCSSLPKIVSSTTRVLEDESESFCTDVFLLHNNVNCTYTKKNM